MYCENINNVLGGRHGYYISYIGMEQYCSSTFVYIYRTYSQDLAADCAWLDPQTWTHYSNWDIPYLGQSGQQALDGLSEVFLPSGLVVGRIEHSGFGVE